MVNIFLKVLLTVHFHQMLVKSNPCIQTNKTNKLCVIKWNDTGKMYWTHAENEVQKVLENQEPSWNLSVIRKQSCPLLEEINIIWFSPNTYSTRIMKMKQGWTFQQDNNAKRSQGDSRLDSEKENKAARMAQPVTLLEFYRISMERTKDQSLKKRSTEPLRFEDCFCERMGQKHTWAMHSTSFSKQEASWSCHYQLRLLYEVLITFQ